MVLPFGKLNSVATARAEPMFQLRSRRHRSNTINVEEAMSTASKQKFPGSSKTTAEQRVKSEIQSMLQINGNTPTARDWVPRVVMMAYERRCANNPTNGELAECFSVARSIAEKS